MEERDGSKERKVKMSKALVVAKDRRLQGVFSQRKKVWELMKKLEECEDILDTDPIPTLLIRSENGKIIQDDHGYRPLTYNNLCLVIRTEEGKAGLYDSETFDPIFAVWEVTMNDHCPDALDEDECDEDEEWGEDD